MSVEMSYAQRVLVVGAGGVGCELLKNLVLTNFLDITIVDLDTIDVSNLNRQFLFRKEHVGKSKAEVAKESVLRFNPAVKVTAIHGSIMRDDLGISFIQQFAIVLNALDNVGARRHVNRLCIAARVPLIESGSSGYVGQVNPIFKGISRCFECYPLPPPRTFPTCTIRNTPTEPIHCIVWAKYLFNLLFGEADVDDDPALYQLDQEKNNENGDDNHVNGNSSESQENLGSVALREWFELARKRTNDTVCGDSLKSLAVAYMPESLLLRRLFQDDIVVLLSMTDLWEKKGALQPKPIMEIMKPEHESDDPTQEMHQLNDQRHLNLQQWSEVFCSSVRKLTQRLEELQANNKKTLIWDKDDEDSMDFVAAASSLRLAVYGMASHTRFQIKSMAGNIVPAIATTNSVVAGLIVLEAIKVLQGREKDCYDGFLHAKKTSRDKFAMGVKVAPPNPNCPVCSSHRPRIVLLCTPDALKHRLTIQNLKQDVLMKDLFMVAPDVSTDMGIIILSSDDEEAENQLTQLLSAYNVRNNTLLDCNDYLQHFSLEIMISEVSDPTVLTNLSEEKRLLLEEKGFLTLMDEDGSRSEQNDGKHLKRSGEESTSDVNSEPPAKKICFSQEPDAIPLVEDDDADMEMGIVFVP